MGGKSKAPPPPDYEGAAIAQGKADKEAAQATAMLSNPNMNSIYGTRRVEYGIGPGGNYIPTITDTLSPDEQAKYDANQAITMSLYGTAQDGLGRVNDSMGNTFNPTGLADYQNIDPSQYQTGQYNYDPTGSAQQYLDAKLPAFFQGRGAPLPTVDALSNDGLTNFGDASVGGLTNVRDAIVGLHSDDFTRQRETLAANLMAQGFSPEDEAYQAQMRDLNQKENDFQLQALLSAGSEQSRVAKDLAAQRGQQFGERKDIYSSQDQTRNRDFAERMAREQQYMRRRQQVANEAFAKAGFAQTQDQINQRGALDAFRQNQASNLQNFNVFNLAAQTNADTRARQYQEQYFQRNIPLNEINALRTGGQVTAPQFQNYTGATVNAAPLYDAAVARGNFDLTNYQNQAASGAGMWDLGGSLLGAAATAGGFGPLFSLGSAAAKGVT